jgi:hypothetical protein
MFPYMVGNRAGYRSAQTGNQPFNTARFSLIAYLVGQGWRDIGRAYDEKPGPLERSLSSESA